MNEEIEVIKSWTSPMSLCWRRGLFLKERTRYVYLRYLSEIKGLAKTAIWIGDIGCPKTAP
jgi:hypothetical protein